MAERRVIEHLAPWLGLLGAGAGWGLAHQLASNAVFDNCRLSSPLLLILACVAGLVVTALGAWFSWDIWRRGERETEGRRFLGLLGVLLAALAAFATLLPALSALMLPPCFG